MSDTSELFSPELKDAMQEITNIGMGRAGYALARVLGTFVELSIPRVNLVSAEEFNATASSLIDIEDDLAAVHQAFFGHWRGETVTVFNQSSCDEVAELLGYSQKDRDYSESELQIDIGNVLSGACLNGIAEVLDFELSYGQPGLLAQHAKRETLFKQQPQQWQHCLLTEVNFALEGKSFKSHLFIMLSEESLATLNEDVEKFMAQY